MFHNKRVIVVINWLPLKNNDDDFSQYKNGDDGKSYNCVLIAMRRLKEEGFIKSKNLIYVGGRSESSTEECIEKNCVPIIIDESDLNDYYIGFCKSYLWPLLHYNLNITFMQNEWDAYVRVNKIFADAIEKIYQPGDIIFIQDYHFMLLPSMLRERIPMAKTGLFLHTPFPTSELFRVLATREELLNGLLGANLIGFQTWDYSRHFLSSCSRILSSDDVESSHNGVYLLNKSRFVSALISQTGIDPEIFIKSLGDQDIIDKFDELNERFKGLKVIIGRDQFDVSKGIIQKMLAFEEFLIQYPDWLGKVVLVQVCTHPKKVEQRNRSEDYRKLIQQINELVGRINGKFGTPNYNPIIYVSNPISWADLVSFYRIADVYLLTSLKDGHNLNSHEYIACQYEKPNAPGTIILSEFAGVSQSLSGSIRINPWDYEQMVRAIHQALTMSLEERKEKQKFNYNYIVQKNALSWATTCLSEIDEIVIDELEHGKQYIPSQLDFKAIKTSYENSEQRILFLDYDGTLVPIVSKPDMAQPSKESIHIIEQLCKDSKNIVYIVSGRDRNDLEEWVGHLPIGLSAEHGCFIRHPPTPEDPSPEWISLIHMDYEWRNTVQNLFEDYTNRTPGSSVEIKTVNITWHYRNADPNYSNWVAKELYTHLTHGLASKMPIEIISGKKAIEVRPKGINKGTSIRAVLKNNKFDFIGCIGDDKTDEDMFAFLQDHNNEVNDKSWSVVVGRKPSFAGYYLKNQKDVIELLKFIIAE